MTNITQHVQTLYRQFRSLPRKDRLVIFGDALMQRHVIESLEYPVLETFDEYQVRVWQELDL